MIGIHFNDLGFNYDSVLYEETCDLFNIKTKEDFRKELRFDLHTAFRIYIGKIRGERFDFDKSNYFDYVQVINDTLR